MVLGTLGLRSRDMKVAIVRILSLTFLGGDRMFINTPSGTLDEPSDTSDATDSSDAVT